MGLFDRVKGAVDKVSAAIDGDALPPPVWAPDQPMATLVESERDPGSSQNSTADGGGLIDLAIDAAVGIPYRFVLDVRRPGFEPYRIEQRTRIPSQVERTWTQGAARVSAGTEVPLTVAGPGAADVAIDWDAYLAIPDRKQRAKHLEGEAQLDRLAAEFERRTKPAQVQKVRAEARTSVNMLADMVLAGSMTRAAFDEQADELIRLGYLLPADYDEARAKLDG